LVDWRSAFARDATPGEHPPDPVRAGEPPTRRGRRSSALSAVFQKQVDNVQTDLGGRWKLDLGQGTDRLCRRRDHDVVVGLDRREAGDGRVSIENRQDAAGPNLAQVLRKVGLEMGDIDRLHGHIITRSGLFGELDRRQAYSSKPRSFFFLSELESAFAFLLLA